LPSYRAILDKEGAADAADVAIIGGEAEVEAQIRRLADAGVTDFVAAPYIVRDEPGALERTYRMVAELARSTI
jgi:alkanesulfonate monooxygenase SsuD/methylene tetrahydromethanopterin reductase-like flavin-dependent oxidoreductase (luciferase family)